MFGPSESGEEVHDVQLVLINDTLRFLTECPALLKKRWTFVVQSGRHSVELIDDMLRYFTPPPRRRRRLKTRPGRLKVWNRMPTAFPVIFSKTHGRSRFCCLSLVSLLIVS